MMTGLRPSTLRADPSRFVPWLAGLFGLVTATTAFTCPGPDPSSPEGTGGAGGAGPTTSSTGGSGGAGGAGSTVTTVTTVTTTGPGGTGGGPCSPDLSTDVLNCGECGRACSVQGIVNVSCNGGVCDSACSAGRLNLAQPQAPAPDDGCEAIEHRAFVTLAGYTPTFGGALGADTLCQTLATANGLGGTWMAWVSDGSTSPAMRFVIDGGPYKRLDGPLLANDWIDLTDGVLAVGISTTETMVTSSDFAVWTGTEPDGTATLLGDNCTDWSSAGPGSALFGYSTNTDGFWTSTQQTMGCDVPFHLYCFEQE